MYYPVIFGFILQKVYAQNCSNGQVYSQIREECEQSVQTSCYLNNGFYDSINNDCDEANTNGLFGNDDISNQSMSDATNDTECNHGNYSLINQTCYCFDGWRTSPIQDILSGYIWCNESVYDDEYYGASELREDTSIGLHMFIAIMVITFVFIFLLKTIVGIICSCKNAAKPKKMNSKRKRHKKRKKTRKKRHVSESTESDQIEMSSSYYVSDDEEEGSVRYESKRKRRHH